MVSSKQFYTEWQGHLVWSESNLTYAVDEDQMDKKK